MGDLSVTTFGMPRILHTTTLCAFPVRKALALALYLAVTAQPHSRDQLAALLWPDADATHSLLNLRQTFLRLRAGLALDAKAHVITTGDLVRLVLGAEGLLDVALLTRATAPKASLEHCLAALQAYHGPFLEH